MGAIEQIMADRSTEANSTRTDSYPGRDLFPPRPQERFTVKRLVRSAGKAIIATALAVTGCTTPSPVSPDRNTTPSTLPGASTNPNPESTDTAPANPTGTTENKGARGGAYENNPAQKAIYKSDEVQNEIKSFGDQDGKGGWFEVWANKQYFAQSAWSKFESDHMVFDNFDNPTKGMAVLFYTENTGPYAFTYFLPPLLRDSDGNLTNKFNYGPPDANGVSGSSPEFNPISVTVNPDRGDQLVLDSNGLPQVIDKDGNITRKLSLKSGKFVSYEDWQAEQKPTQAPSPIASPTAINTAIPATAAPIEAKATQAPSPEQLQAIQDLTSQITSLGGSPDQYDLAYSGGVLTATDKATGQEVFKDGKWEVNDSFKKLLSNDIKGVNLKPINGDRNDPSGAVDNYTNGIFDKIYGKDPEMVKRLVGLEKGKILLAHSIFVCKFPNGTFGWAFVVYEADKTPPFNEGKQQILMFETKDGVASWLPVNRD